MASNSKQLTIHLRQLSNEAESIHDDGSIITKAEALAVLMWRNALGWEEKDPDNPDKTIMHKPAQWAAILIWDRLEGKAPNAVEDADGLMTVADKVGELAKNRMNALAAVVIGGPPPYNKDSDVSE